MRKKIIIIFILVLLVSVALFLFTKPKEQKIECVMDLEKAFNDVNEFYINEFELLDLSFDRPTILFN